jgi:hypothetical protein
MIEAGECKVSIYDLDGNLIEAKAMTEAEFIKHEEDPKRALVVYPFMGKESEECQSEIKSIFSQIADMGYSPEIPLQNYGEFGLSGSCRLRETISFERYQAVIICDGYENDPHCCNTIDNLERFTPRPSTVLFRRQDGEMFYFFITSCGVEWWMSSNLLISGNGLIRIKPEDVIFSGKMKWDGEENNDGEQSAQQEGLLSGDR